MLTGKQKVRVKTTLQIPSAYFFPAHITNYLGRQIKNKLKLRSSNSK